MSSASQHKVSPSPRLSTPSKLHRYLSYAERHLGIHDVSRYESFLAKENYGPDVFEDLPDDILVRSPVKMPWGDVIRLKRGCATWWEHESKRAHIGPGHSSPIQQHSTSPSTSSPQNASHINSSPVLEVWYAIEFPGGGEALYHGPPMRPGTPSDADRCTKYFSDALDTWLPVPEGYCAPWYSTEGREYQRNVFEKEKNMCY